MHEAINDFPEQFSAAIAAAGLTPPPSIEADAQTWRADIGRNHRQTKAAMTAEAIYDESTPEDGSHPYLAHKGVPAVDGLRSCEVALLEKHGVKFGEGFPRGRVLVILLSDYSTKDGVICSLQFIDEAGEKRLLPGGRKQGCCFLLKGDRNDPRRLVAKGYATAASLHQATGLTVVMAVDAGNLKEVASVIRARLPGKTIVLCADDDYRTEGNPGRTKATEAAQAVGGLLALPDFGANRPEGATNFNDLQRERGAEAVKQAIAGATAPASEHQSSGDSLPEGDSWPDPLPIPDALPSVKPFDYALLPDSLRPWIADIAERVQCPADFPAVGAMISLAAVVGRKVGIRPKRRDDWLEVPNLWGAIVGRAGVLKSPALREVMRPLRKIEAKAAAAFENDAKEWRRTRELSELRRVAERSNIVKDLKKGIAVAPHRFGDDLADDEPHARRYVVNDCSVEALGEILRFNPNGTLAYRDELIGLLKSLDKEGNEGARGFFLQAWSGTDGYTFDRIGRGLNMRIEACCLSLLGSIQPSVIGGYLRQAVADGGADGLLSRFQLLAWPDIGGAWRDVDRRPDTEAKAAAYATFERLDSLAPLAMGATAEDGGIPYLRFDDSAQELFSEWRADLEQRIRSGNDHAAFEAHLAKYRKLVPALALLIHLADDGGAAVGETALLKALSWAEYLESHARRAYASVLQADAESARVLLNRICRKEVPDPFGPRDVYLKHWAYLSKPEEVHEAARLLCDLDYLREDRIDTGGRPKSLYSVNPKARAA